MNVCQGQKGQKRTTTAMIIPTRKFCSIMSVLNLSLTCIYVISNALQGHETEVEEAAQVLEHFIHGTSSTNAYLSTVLQPTLSFVAPDFPNTYWVTIDDPNKQGEKLTLIREVVDAMPELDMIHLLYEVFATRCQGPLGNIVHTPTFMKQAEWFCDCFCLASAEAQAMALCNTISMETIACNVLAVRMTMYSRWKRTLTVPLLTAHARSCLSSHTICTWLVSYASDSSVIGHLVFNPSIPPLKKFLASCTYKSSLIPSSFLNRKASSS